ncbi:MAG: HlyD family efflux transporter periplasmic adaptor subunit, partial [Planctomycetes bacterium]|nr:HlyD family efflux transporter periplasmic adaptor subunit [Planctomycetota bacterium]
AEAAAAEAAATAAADTATASERELAAARTHLAVDEELAAEPVDLDTDLAVASAELERLRQRVAAAATELAIAERELGWAERVVAPVDGIVMRLDAMPGQTTGPGSGAIVALYDPNHLQARLDVPLDSVAEIRSGQDVELTSEITGKTVVAGEVLRIQHVTDLLKNTLQVKVRLEAPPAIWRPETLCRARFFRGLDLDAAQPAKAAATVFLVPKSTIRDGRVYVIEPAHGVARAIPVTVVGEDGDLAIVGGELSVTQRVIREAVADGEAVEEKQP